MWPFAIAPPVSLFAAAWEDGFFVGAALVVGGLFGSFLNVIGYRVPIGRSVVAGRSACPACGQPVRAYDNVPVLGWLILRGRCRDCGTAIPSRYALVEAGCGLALAALAAADVVVWRATGSSLPLIDRVVTLGDWRWLCGWTGRGLAILTAVAWALLARGGHIVAWRSVVVATAVVAALATAASPSLGQGIAAAVGGAAVGWAAGRPWPAAMLSRTLMLVGAAAGWQGVALTAVLVVTAGAARRALGAASRLERGPGHPCDLATAAAVGLVAATLVGPVLGGWFRTLFGW